MLYLPDSVVGHCRQCNYLDNKARAREDFALYRTMLKAIRKMEEEYKDDSHVIFLIQVSCTRPFSNITHLFFLGVWSSLFNWKYMGRAECSECWERSIWAHNGAMGHSPTLDAMELYITYKGRSRGSYRTGWSWKGKLVSHELLWWFGKPESWGKAKAIMAVTQRFPSWQSLFQNLMYTWS